MLDFNVPSAARGHVRTNHTFKILLYLVIGAEVHPVTGKTPAHKSGHKSAANEAKSKRSIIIAYLNIYTSLFTTD